MLEQSSTPVFTSAPGSVAVISLGFREALEQCFLGDPSKSGAGNLLPHEFKVTSDLGFQEPS